MVVPEFHLYCTLFQGFNLVDIHQLASYPALQKLEIPYNQLTGKPNMYLNKHIMLFQLALQCSCHAFLMVEQSLMHKYNSASTKLVA